MHLAVVRALKFLFGVALALALLFLAFSYGLYFAGAPHAPGDWGPAPATYPDAVRRAWWRIEAGSEPVASQAISPPGMLWRVVRELQKDDLPRWDPQLRALHRVARLEDSHYSTGHHRLAEWAMSIQASHWPEDRVVDTILARSYFGCATYGADAAAQRLFATPLASLDDAQVALLVSLMQGPAVFDPWNHGDRLRKRMATRAGLDGRQIDAAFAKLAARPTNDRCP